MGEKRLIILTTHFGTNFSGGSTATCEVFSRLENRFSEIVVIGTELGDHPFHKLHFKKYRNWLHAVRLIKAFERQDTLFYGDFYNSILFVLAGVPFYFTYHDNWPEQSELDFTSKLAGLYFTPIYKSVFRRAFHVSTVSNFKLNFVKQFNDRASIIHNGFNREHSIMTSAVPDKKQRLLMVGNIDRRKYQLALPLFDRMREGKQVQIDVYGHYIDRALVKKMQTYSFVHLKGYTSKIPYSNYRALLHTSMSESFGMVFCEAIDNGVPVIAFDVGGAREVVLNGSGILTQPYKIEAMYQAIFNVKDQFKAIDSDELKQYSWEKASKAYQDLMLPC